MSKAYVIKNKEGKYFGYFDGITGKSEFSNKPQKFIMFNTIRNAKHIKNHFDLKDCEVVEITIAEGDLEKENAMLRKALELACVPRDDWNCKEPKRIKYTSNYDYFIEQAKEQRND